MRAIETEERRGVMEALVDENAVGALRTGRALSTAAFEWPRLLVGDSDPSTG
jgi:hypothetical protein